MSKMHIDPDFDAANEEVCRQAGGGVRERAEKELAANESCLRASPYRDIDLRVPRAALEAGFPDLTLKLLPGGKRPS